MGQLGVGSVVALVLLRLAVGWHFYTEGMKKFEPGFTSAGLLSNATGPLGPFFRSFVPKPGGFATTLAAPRMLGSLSDEQADANAQWRKEYTERVKASRRAGETPLAEFPPHSAYSAWAEAIAEDWRTKRDQAAKLAGEADPAVAAAEEVYRQNLQRLADYLAEEADEIEVFRHELWRLETMRDTPGATEIDYREERIADKSADTSRTGWRWWTAVSELEEGYIRDLAAAAGDRPQADTVRAWRTRSWLTWIDPAVICVVTGVGVCMMLGLFTRLAGVVGAAFLLSVIASQPPWVPGADTTYFGYQLAEVGAMLTLATVGAGQWYGLDSVLRRVCPACCGPR